jgi:hypothetical protein
MGCEWAVPGGSRRAAVTRVRCGGPRRERW